MPIEQAPDINNIQEQQQDSLQQRKAMEESLTKQVKGIDEAALFEELTGTKAPNTPETNNPIKAKIFQILQKWDKIYKEAEKKNNENKDLPRSGEYQMMAPAEPYNEEEAQAIAQLVFGEVGKITTLSLQGKFNEIQAEKVIDLIEQIDTYKSKHDWHAEEIWFKLNMNREVLEEILKSL